MMNGVLVTFLVDNRVYSWDKAQIGWLIGIPVLTGSVMRLPMGVLTDKYGGRLVFTVLMLVSSVPIFLVSYANTYAQFLLAGLGFGLTGASFAVGVAYTSLWFPQKSQGTALGIFGVGNAGAALTSMVAPIILNLVTNGAVNADNWRLLPKIYAGLLVVSGLIFWLLTYTKKAEGSKGLSFGKRLAPLQSLRVWRFGLYYFFVFGGFVALSQWLIPYYVNVYSMPLASAGLMTAFFSLPAGVIRAVGGVLSDKLGARSVLYWVFGISIILLFFLFPPRMEIQSPGEGLMAGRSGAVTKVSHNEIIVGETRYELRHTTDQEHNVQVRLGIPREEGNILVLPIASSWQEPVVKVGDTVEKGQLIARGVTQIYFQANKWIFSGFVLLLGVMMGIGSAAVFKHIPTYFPESVGVVGGIVGVLGGLGGFFNPIIFGYLLKGTGIWTTCWIFLEVVVLACLIWMHLVIRRLMFEKMPLLIRQIENVK